MKFFVESLHKNCGRLGSIVKSEQLKYETPLLLMYTKAASIPYISHEVFDFLQLQSCFKALEISTDTVQHMQKALTATAGQGILSYAGYTHEYLTFLTLKNPAELCPSGFHDKDQVSIFSRKGRTTVTVEEYMSIVEACKPDIFHCLCDGDTNPLSGKKRIAKSVQRTETFIEKCLTLYHQSDCLKNSMFIAPIEGGFSIPARKNMINGLAKHSAAIGGYFLDGFHSNGNDVALLCLNQNNLQDIIKNSLDDLPIEKPKFMLGAYNPLIVLKLIQMGIDVFDSSFAYLATLFNCALTFQFNVKSPECREFDLDLEDDRYKDDFQPIIKDCTCLTCQKHTRAYIRHLVNTKELLAPILLMIHNTHHYVEFFKAIRLSLAIGDDGLASMIKLLQGQFENDRSKFIIKIKEKSEDKCSNSVMDELND